MKSTSLFVRGATGMALLIGSTLLAQTVKPNGFPSGAHYNLNIIGKKLDYQCAPATPDPLTGLYGNVVFVPENGEGIQILIKSGRMKGGKTVVPYTELQVIDCCAAAFDGTPAVVELPPSENGYRVYARALAKPVGTDWKITYGGSLFSAKDEAGNDLIDLGLITGNAVGSTGETLVRTKGKSMAVDITPLFSWVGTVCDVNYEGTPLPYVIGVDQDPSVYKLLCWSDLLGDGLTPDDLFAKPVTDPISGLPSCATGTGVLSWVPVICTSYTAEDPEWIFNLADLVESDWLVKNDGTKLVQIRFYPVQ